MAQQMTIVNPVRAFGIGLHHGEMNEVHILPGDRDMGIVFHAMDEWQCDELIPATIDNVVSTPLRSTIKGLKRSIDTIEHLMSALMGLGIDNAVIKVWGNELPILDGSPMGWCDIIIEAGLTEQDSDRKMIKVLKKVTVESDGSRCSLEPNHDQTHGLVVEYHLESDHPMIGNQCGRVEVSKKTYLSEIAGSRTFGFMSDIEKITKLNLARGASTENTLIFDHNSLMNSNGLRWPDEPMRHKIADVIGDLYLAGKPISGLFVGHKSGHALNQRLVMALLADETSWTIAH